MLTGANSMALGLPVKKTDQAAAVTRSLAGKDIPLGAVERAKAAVLGTTPPQSKQTAKRTAGDHFSPESATRTDETKKPKPTTSEQKQVEQEVLARSEESRLTAVTERPDRTNEIIKD